jgi:ABC-type multidrug transport system fused ATPase/permease subunit
MYVYLLDFVNPSKNVDVPFFGHDRILYLVAYSSASIIAIAILHSGDYYRTCTRLGANSWNFLQEALFRKFLNYSNPMRQDLQAGAIISAMQRDAVDMVTDGYSSFLQLLKLIGHVACMLFFKLVSPHVFGKKLNIDVLLPLLALPLLFMLYLPVRERAIRQALEAENKLQGHLINHISVVVHNIDLVLDYEVRDKVSTDFCANLAALNRAGKVSQQVLTNTVYFAKWATTIVVALYIYVGGHRVLSGSLSLGMFVTDLKIIDATGSAFVEMFEILVRMQSIFLLLKMLRFC